MPVNLASEKIVIPKKYNKEERLAIAADIIEYIRERSSKGKGPGNVPWKGRYSLAYSKSLDFKNAGKSPTKITQSLSGDMLTEIEILPGTERSTGQVVIGYSRGSDQYGKAEGNIIGSYGRSPDPKKARPFLTLTAKEVKAILERYPLNDEAAREEAVQSRKDAAERIKGQVDFDDEMGE